jgi:hypothetical protein
MPLVALTLDTPCYLISGLASDLTVQVRIDDKLIPLSTTQFTLVEGQCTDILVTTQEYFATASATFPSNAWGVVQQVTEIDGLTVAVSDGGKGISATFYYVPVIPLTPPVVHDTVAPPGVPQPGVSDAENAVQLGPGPVKLPPGVDPIVECPGPAKLPLAGTVSINGGSISNGIENSVLQFFYNVTGGTSTTTSPVLSFGQGSDVLTNATITGFTVAQPPTAKSKPYRPVENVTVQDGMSVVVMQRPIGEPVGPVGIVDYYLASMVPNGPVATTSLTHRI